MRPAKPGRPRQRFVLPQAEGPVEPQSGGPCGLYHLLPEHGAVWREGDRKRRHQRLRALLPLLPCWVFWKHLGVERPDKHKRRRLQQLLRLLPDKQHPDLGRRDKPDPGRPERERDSPVRGIRLR